MSDGNSSTSLVASSDDDAVVVLDMNHTIEKMLISVGYPILRLVLALGVVWIASSASS